MPPGPFPMLLHCFCCQGWRSLQAALDGFSPAERPRVEKRLSQLLADPFALQVIVDELLKSSWSTRPNHFSEEACFWTMLLFAGAQAGLGGPFYLKVSRHAVDFLSRPDGVRLDVCGRQATAHGAHDRAEEAWKTD